MKAFRLGNNRKIVIDAVLDWQVEAPEFEGEGDFLPGDGGVTETINESRLPLDKALPPEIFPSTMEDHFYATKPTTLSY